MFCWVFKHFYVETRQISSFYGLYYRNCLQKENFIVKCSHTNEKVFETPKSLQMIKQPKRLFFILNIINPQKHFINFFDYAILFLRYYMFQLLNPKDKDVLKNSNFVKNAVFYKDMLCFYNAYVEIAEKKENLPNFCFSADNELCLEGVCLLMKMYATEFKFETLKLSLEYLKILYFAVASYAENNTVDSEIIIAEFDEYRLASEKYCEEQKQSVLSQNVELKKTEKQVQAKLKKVLSLESWAKALKISAWTLLVLSLLAVAIPILIASSGKQNSILLWGSIVGIILGFILTVAFLICSKRLKNHASDLSYHCNNAKKELNLKIEEFNEIQAKFYRVFCERYEYSMCFPELFSRFVKVLSIDQILDKAREYRLLSYNVIYDINRLFRSQQKEIDSVIAELEEISHSSDYQLEFARIYSNIISQDWMYYNAEIRYHFLKKFTDISEREHDWKLEFNGIKINPFEVDVKALSREKIAFTESEDMRLVTANLSEFIKTNYFKNLDDLSFRNGYSSDLFKKVKANYLMHFYNAEVLEGDAVFFDSRMNKKLPVQKMPLSKLTKIPTLVGMKLKLIEKATGLGNNDAKVIKTIASSIFSDFVEENIENLCLKEEDIDYPKFTASKIENEEDMIKYHVGDRVTIGYKLK